MNRIMFLAIICLLMFSFSKSAYSQAVKIGVVDVEMVLKEIPEAIASDKKLKDLGQVYKDSLVKIQKEYNSRREQYDKQKAMMKPDQQKKEEETMKALEQTYMQFQEEKFGVQGEIAQLRDKLLEPIRDKLKTAVSAVAKDEGMSFVMNKVNDVLLYSEDKFDITYRVIDKIKRGEDGGTGKEK